MTCKEARASLINKQEVDLRLTTNHFLIKDIPTLVVLLLRACLMICIFLTTNHSLENSLAIIIIKDQVKHVYSNNNNNNDNYVDTGRERHRSNFAHRQGNEGGMFFQSDMFERESLFDDSMFGAEFNFGSSRGGARSEGNSYFNMSYIFLIFLTNVFVIL